MYINYINDRKSLGFMCLKDIEAGDQVTYSFGNWNNLYCYQYFYKF